MIVSKISEEFPAHAANVNSVSLGHKSGRVLVTGGGDKKVNLWAIGKPNCIMVSPFSIWFLLQSIVLFSLLVLLNRGNGT